MRLTGANVGRLVEGILDYIVTVDSRTAYLHDAVKKLAEGEKLDMGDFDKRLAVFEDRVSRAIGNLDRISKMR